MEELDGCSILLAATLFVSQPEARSSITGGIGSKGKSLREDTGHPAATHFASQPEAQRILQEGLAAMGNSYEQTQDVPLPLKVPRGSTAAQSTKVQQEQKQVHQKRLVSLKQPRNRQDLWDYLS